MRVVVLWGPQTLGLSVFLLTGTTLGEAWYKKFFPSRVHPTDMCTHSSEKFLQECSWQWHL